MRVAELVLCAWLLWEIVPGGPPRRLSASDSLDDCERAIPYAQANKVSAPRDGRAAELICWPVGVDPSRR